MIAGNVCKDLTPFLTTGWPVAASRKRTLSEGL